MWQPKEMECLGLGFGPSGLYLVHAQLFGIPSFGMNRKKLKANLIEWEDSHMTTLVRADEKGRICIPGTKRGGEYLVQAEEGGSWVAPVQKMQAPKRQSREWAGSKMSLVEHLTRLADSGLQLERSAVAKQKVPTPRF